MLIKYQPIYAIAEETRVPAAERFDRDIPNISVWYNGQTKWVPDSLKHGNRTLVEILLVNPDFVEVTPQEH